MMPDREKVIKAIDICLGHGKCVDCGYHTKGGYYSTMDCRKPMMRDALELLKEQQETIASFQSTILKLNAALKEQPEIVRCAKCAHGHLVSSGFCVCDKYGNAHYHDWYCADGEKR